MVISRGLVPDRDSGPFAAVPLFCNPIVGAQWNRKVAKLAKTPQSIALLTRALSDPKRKS